MRAVIIHGAMATGKTVNRDAFRSFYMCGSVLDDWPFAHEGRRKIREGDLVLTNLGPAEIAKRLLKDGIGDVRMVSIDEARKAIGLSPAPANGFPIERRRRA